MAYSVLMAVEGVLSDDTYFNLIESPPLSEGVLLFHALRSQFHVVLSTTQLTEEPIRRWLQYTASIKPTDWSRLMLGKVSDGDALHARRRHMLVSRAAGYDMRYMVSPDPRVARTALSMGYTPLLCPHPLYSRSSFLPDSAEGGASWDTIESEVMAGRLAFQNDPRLAMDDHLEEEEVP